MLNTGIHSDVRSQRFSCSNNMKRFIFHISAALKNIKTTQCPTLFGVLPRSLLKYIPRRKASPHPPKTATYQQRECTQWFIHSFKRTWNLGSISVPASLCICCTAEQRDLVGLSSLIFLLVFCMYFALSLSLSPSDLSHHMETKVMADWNIIEV